MANVIGGNVFALRSDRTNPYILDSLNILKCYDEDAAAFIPILKLPEAESFIYMNFIDSDNRLWLITEHGKMAQVNLVNKTYTELKLNWYGFSNDSRLSHTGKFVEDANGNIWTGTGGSGLLKFSNAAARFKHVPTDTRLFSERMSLFRTSSVHHKAVYDSKIMDRWLKMCSSESSVISNLCELTVQSNLCVDGKGDFWLLGEASHGRDEGVYRINPQTKTVELVYDIQDGINSWIGVPIFPDHLGNIWFSERKETGATLFYKYDPNLRKVVSFPFPVETEKYEYRFVSDWHIDTASNIIWLATTHGLFSFSINTNTWNSYRHDDADTLSLSNNMLLSICPDPLNPKTFIWVGTEGYGLNKFNLETKNFIRYTTESGLPNDVIYSIQSDTLNNLWIGTNAGLCQFNPQAGSFCTYTIEDGIPSDEFNRYEFSRSREGELYFGTMGGVFHFNPSNFYENAKPSKVIFNHLYLFNKPVAYNIKTDHKPSEFRLPLPIELCTQLTFGPDQGMITFGFAVMDLTAPDKNKFKYRLIGLHDKWVSGGQRNEASFTDLSPGNYTLQVLGCNSNNVWNTDPTTIHITILPPWYATWWFRSLIAFLLGSILYGFYRYRVAELLRVEKMRNRIAQDLHDEIGSTLSSISLYSAVMQRSADKMPEKINDILGKIIDSTSEMMESMNDMVWTIKADNDSFEHVVYRMRAFAGTMTEAKDMVLQFKVDPKAEKLELGMEKRKNIYLIFKETVNNAAKYSNAKKLSVVIRQEEDLLIMQIKDDGIGFDPENYNRKNELLGGNGLQGMMGRAKEMNADMQIEASEGNGCIITLKVPT